MSILYVIITIFLMLIILGVSLYNLDTYKINLEEDNNIKNKIPSGKIGQFKYLYTLSKQNSNNNISDSKLAMLYVGVFLVATVIVILMRNSLNFDLMLGFLMITTYKTFNLFKEKLSKKGYYITFSIIAIIVLYSIIKILRV